MKTIASDFSGAKYRKLSANPHYIDTQTNLPHKYTRMND